MVEAEEFENKARTGVSSNDPDVKEWFQELTHFIKTEKMLYESKALSDQKVNLYSHLAKDEMEEVMKTVLHQFRHKIISDVLLEYINEIVDRKVNFSKLAVDLGVNKILVWAQLSNDDEKSEDNLILAEAKINNKYYDLGFGVSSTIVFDEDELSVPSHYEQLKED